MNYKLTITKSRNARCFYIQTSYRKSDGRMSTKTVRRLGSEKTIKELHGVDDAEAWARGQLAQMREADRKELREEWKEELQERRDEWREELQERREAPAPAAVPAEVPQPAEVLSDEASVLDQSSAPLGNE